MKHLKLYEHFSEEQITLNREATGQKINLDKEESLRGIEAIEAALQTKSLGDNIGLVASDFSINFGGKELEVYDRGYLIRDEQGQYHEFKYGNKWYNMFEDELKDILEKNPKHFLGESSETAEPTLRDIIGNIKSEKKVGYTTIYETEKGCISNALGGNYRNINILDCNVKYHKYGDNYGEIMLNHPDLKYGFYYYVYLENDFPKIISSYPGDERGCILFKDVFIASGHDGNYLWDVKTGEFKRNTW